MLEAIDLGVHAALRVLLQRAAERVSLLRDLLRGAWLGLLPEALCDRTPQLRPDEREGDRRRDGEHATGEPPRRTGDRAWRLGNRRHRRQVLRGFLHLEAVQRRDLRTLGLCGELDGAGEAIFAFEHAVEHPRGPHRIEAAAPELPPPERQTGHRAEGPRGPEREHEPEGPIDLERRIEEVQPEPDRRGRREGETDAREHRIDQKPTVDAPLHARHRGHDRRRRHRVELELASVRGLAAVRARRALRVRGVVAHGCLARVCLARVGARRRTSLGGAGFSWASTASEAETIDSREGSIVG
ncbi:MAG: hypothetical protein ACK5QR_07435 [bacterium]